MSRPRAAFFGSPEFAVPTLDALAELADVVAVVAQPDKPVVLVSGDGGFMFTVQELATAVQHKIGLVTLVFNDGAFGNVRRMQKENYGGRFIASNLQNPDFVKMAESYGAQGLRADSPEALRGALRQAFATPDVPTIIDVPVGEVPSPWPIIMAPQNLLAQID